MEQKAKEPEKRPSCPRKRINDKGKRITCLRPAVWCNVIGELGTKTELLCNPCIQELRKAGWNVRYQIEGDKPAPADQAIT